MIFDACPYHFPLPLTPLQEINTNTDLQPLPRLLASPYHQWQAEVQLKPRHGVRIHQTEASGNAGQAIRQLSHRTLHAARNSAGIQRRRTLSRLLALECNQTAAVGEELQPQGGGWTGLGEGKKHIDRSSCEDVTANGVDTIMRTEAAHGKTTDIGRTAELEAIVDAARGDGSAGEGVASGQRVEKTGAEAGADGDAGKGEGLGGRQFDLGLCEGNVALERTPTSELGDGAQKVTGLGERGVVAAVTGKCVGDGALERVTGIGADGGRGGGGKAGQLAPDTRVAERVVIAVVGRPGETEVTAGKMLVMRGPRLLSRGAQTLEGETDIGVAVHRGREDGVVGRPGTGTGGSVDGEGLGSAKNVAQDGIGVSGSLSVAKVGAGAEDEAGLFLYADGDVELGAVGGGLELLLLLLAGIRDEDTKAILLEDACWM